MRGIALHIQHLRAIANAAAWPPPRPVYYPCIEIAAAAHHDHLFMHIHLAHLVEDRIAVEPRRLLPEAAGRAGERVRVMRDDLGARAVEAW